MQDNTEMNLIEYLEKQGGKQENESWTELAERFSLVSGGSARNIWLRYRKAKKHGMAYNPKIEEAQIRKGATAAETANYIAALEDEVARILEKEIDHATGAEKITLQSTKPLSPKELEELAGVDNISTFIDRSWLKSHRNDTWTYSILTVNKVKNFYSSEELTTKLKEIFSSHTSDATEIPIRAEVSSDKALFVYIGDDHAGSLITSSLFNKEYSGTTYAQRLQKLADKIKSLQEVFSRIYIVRMGDELDGYNAKTTRYDHDLGSASNKEQFDIYTTANKLFYSEVFESGRAQQYTVINLNNSNHCGNGYAYIANKALEFWMEGRYTNVEVKHQNKFIDIYHFGNHIIGMCHGKDEKHMKSPWPINLDIKTDLWLMDFYKLNIRDGHFVSTIKADMHKMCINYGKSGRYVNVPSVSSGSMWIEHNYGDSKPGCLMEIYTANDEDIQSIPVWF